MSIHELASHPEQIHTQPNPEVVLNTDHMVLLTGRANPELGRDIGNILGMTIDEPVTIYPDTETNVKISNSLRDKSVFIIQSGAKNFEDSDPNKWIRANDAVMELFFMIHAAKRADAKRINVVAPYFPYERGDKKDKPRVTIPAADVARMLIGAGASRILTVDIHSDQQQGYVDEPWDNVHASTVLLPEMQRHGTDNLVVVTADVGGTKRARKASKLLGLPHPIAIVDKDRHGPGDSEVAAIIGDVRGKDVEIFDDMVDTAGSIRSAAIALEAQGANSIRVFATHGLFNGRAIENIENSPIKQVVVTDTVHIPKYIRNHPKIHVVSIAPLLAEAIRRQYTGQSISEIIPQDK